MCESDFNQLVNIYKFFNLGPNVIKVPPGKQKSKLLFFQCYLVFTACLLYGELYVTPLVTFCYTECTNKT